MLFQSLAFPVLLATAVSALLPLPRPDLPDKGAPFLHVPAFTVTHLLHEVQSDPQACRRYARFFHLPFTQVEPYLQKNVQAGKLPRAGRYTVYFVSHDGTVYPGWMTLAAETPVFVTKTGSPLLLLGTGDPLIPFMPVVDVKKVPAGILPRAPQQEVVPTAGNDVPVPAAPIRLFPSAAEPR